MSFVTEKKYFESVVDTWSKQPSINLPIQYENVIFNPPNDDRYVIFNILYLAPSVPSLGVYAQSNYTIRYNNILQLTFITPPNKGKNKTLELAESLKKYILQTPSYTLSDGDWLMVNASPSLENLGLDSENNKYLLVLSIPFQRCENISNI